VRGLVFEAKNSLGALAETVGAACRRLTDANVPHNLFIVDRGARIFLLPNAFAERKVHLRLDSRLLTPASLHHLVAAALIAGSGSAVRLNPCI
jgi:hypothetical protein